MGLLLRTIVQSTTKVIITRVNADKNVYVIRDDNKSEPIISQLNKSWSNIPDEFPDEFPNDDVSIQYFDMFECLSVWVFECLSVWIN